MRNEMHWESYHIDSLANKLKFASSERFQLLPSLSEKILSKFRLDFEFK